MFNISSKICKISSYIYGNLTVIVKRLNLLSVSLVKSSVDTYPRGFPYFDTRDRSYSLFNLLNFCHISDLSWTLVGHSKLVCLCKNLIIYNFLSM